jgi:hypothetical protein
LAFVTGMVTMLSSTASIYSIFWCLTNCTVGYGQYVYKGGGGVEGALNCVNFVNAIDVAQNIKKCVPLVIIYSFLISMNSKKDNILYFLF